jgi:uncharacterized protein (TIGR00369 family)
MEVEVHAQQLTLVPGPRDVGACVGHGPSWFVGLSMAVLTGRPGQVPELEPAALLAMMPFAVATGVELDRASPEEVTGRLPWSPERCTAGGTMHGGALMTLADTVGAVCAFLNMPPGASTTTVASSTSLMRGVRSGTAHAVARPRHAGRSFVTVLVEVTDDEGRPVAHVTQTQAVLGG